MKLGINYNIRCHVKIVFSIHVVHIIYIIESEIMNGSTSRVLNRARGVRKQKFLRQNRG